MKKTLVSLFLALLMLTSFVLSACNSNPSDTVVLTDTAASSVTAIPHDTTVPDSDTEADVVHEHTFVDGRCSVCGETDGLQYVLQDDGTYLVSGYNGSKTIVYTSDTHDNKPVVGIAENGFSGNDVVKVILLADGMKSIGSGAFADCNKLVDIYIPDSIEYIGSSLFKDCLTIEDVVFWGTREQWDKIDKASDWASEDIKSKVLVNFGSPWTTTTIMYNRPTRRPRVQDDIYTYCNFDFIVDHDVFSSSSSSTELEMRTRFAEMLTDTTISDPELDTLRVLFNQLVDTDKMKAYGMETIKPYIDKIDAVNSIEEFNALLTSDDFWFSPFINVSYNCIDASGVHLSLEQNSVYLYDNNLYYYGAYDDISYIGDIYWWSRLLMNIDFQLLGMDAEEAGGVCSKIMTFEKSLYDDKFWAVAYENMDFGAIPVEDIIKKYGFDLSDGAFVYKNYFENLNSYWNDEHLDILKLVTKARVLLESRPYRDNSIYDDARNEYAAIRRIIESAAEMATDACNSRFTFADVIAKSFVKYRIGEQGLARLNGLTEDIIAAYKDLLAETDWLNNETKNELIEKLDKVRKCILQPAEGYLDYSGLKLSSEDAPLENYFKLVKYRYALEAQNVLGKTGVSVRWYIVPPTDSNFYYNPEDNSINIYPGYVSQKTYNNDMTDAEMYGAIGFAIAHEISHGLTGIGAYYNADGEKVDCIYKDEDTISYNNLVKKVIDYLNTIEAKDGMYVGGERCYVETMADILAFEAIIQVMKSKGNNEYGKMSEAFANFLALSDLPAYFDIYFYDNHLMNNLRVNVTLQMQKEICDYYGFKEGDKMYLPPEDRIVIFGSRQ